MDKSLDELPVPEINTSLVGQKKEKMKQKDEKFSFLDKLLSKNF